MQISKKNEPQKPPVSAEGPGHLTENMPKITVHVRTDKVIKSSPVQEEVKTTSTQEEAKLESEETLYYKYQVGTNKVLMKVIPKDDKKPEVPMATDDDVIVLTTMEDGSKELSFKFNELTSTVSGETLQVNQIYNYIVDILQTRTNFQSLDNQSRYLTAIARLIESAYFNLGAVDRESQKIFDELANVLELKNKDTFPSQTEQKSTTVLQDNVLQDAIENFRSLPSYISEEELIRETTVDSIEEKISTSIPDKLTKENSNEKMSSKTSEESTDESASFQNIDDYLYRKNTESNSKTNLENKNLDKNNNLKEKDEL
jgi:hypothetical protein